MSGINFSSLSLYTVSSIYEVYFSLSNIHFTFLYMCTAKWGFFFFIHIYFCSHTAGISRSRKLRPEKYSGLVPAHVVTHSQPIYKLQMKALFIRQFSTSSHHNSKRIIGYSKSESNKLVRGLDCIKIFITATKTWV